MRRQLAITALCVAMLVAPLWAQMRGSSRGGGGTGRAIFSSRPSVGIRSGPAFASAPRVTVRFGSSFRRPIFGPRRFHHRAFFPAFSPYYFGYYGYPAYYSGYYSTLDSYPVYDYYTPYPAQNGNELAQQQQDIDRLEEEVARLREDRGASEVASAKPPAESKSEPSTPTLLVFRDKHTQEVKNYAVVGGTLWIFNEQRATKLPLSWLDIEATTKANDERGVSFQLPK